MPVALWSLVLVRGASLAGIALSNTTEELMSVIWECCVLSSRGHSSGRAIPTDVCLSVIWIFENGGKNNPYSGLDRPLGFQETESPRLSRRSAHEGSKVVSPEHRPLLLLKRYSWCSFLLDSKSSVAEVIKGKKKSQWLHRESKKSLLYVLSGKYSMCT
jgi:hypothetical protein